MALWSRRSASAWRPFANASRFIERGAAAPLAAFVLAGLTITAKARTISGLARVDGDGRLVVAGERIALAGIEMPVFGRVCRQSASPVRCGPPSVLVLDGLVHGFVHCEIVGGHGQSLLEGRCTIATRRLLDDRLDLAAELLRRAWAFAWEDAPGLYRSLERLARTREIGIWSDAAVEWR